MKLIIDVITKSTVLFTLAVMPLAGGCANRHTTTVTTTEVESPRAEYRDNEKREVSRTESTTVDNHAESHGLFGIIGDIIALPFRAVGALLSAIF